jgi:preprotein translocase subunit SecF
MIRFSKYIWVYFFISALVLIPGMYSLVRYGLAPSIDFAGGTLLELRAPKALDESTIESAAAKQGLALSNVQHIGDASYLLRMKAANQSQLTATANDIASRSGTTVTIVRNETVGPVLGKELLSKATVAAFFAIATILLYVAWAFKNIRFGVAAVVALVHDLLVVLGVFSLLGHFKGVEVDTLFVTAFLTTMSFSVHDTIVVFDRIREYLKRDRSQKFEDICDRALMETINRSFTNSFTIIIMLLALVLMGGESIRWFLVALLIGTVSGTYSSPFIATPVLMLWHHWDKRKNHGR